MTGTYTVSYDRSGFGIVQLRLTNAQGQEVALMEFAPGDTVTYLQPGDDLDIMSDHEAVLRAIVGK
jgi:hypothetical protein